MGTATQTTRLRILSSLLCVTTPATLNLSLGVAGNSPSTQCVVGPGRPALAMLSTMVRLICWVWAIEVVVTLLMYAWALCKRRRGAPGNEAWTPQHAALARATWPLTFRREVRESLPRVARMDGQYVVTGPLKCVSDFFTDTCPTGSHPRNISLFQGDFMGWHICCVPPPSGRRLRNETGRPR